MSIRIDCFKIWLACWAVLITWLPCVLASEPLPEISGGELLKRAREAQEAHQHYAFTFVEEDDYRITGPLSKTQHPSPERYTGIYYRNGRAFDYFRDMGASEDTPAVKHKTLERTIYSPDGACSFYNSDLYSVEPAKGQDISVPVKGLGQVCLRNSLSIDRDKQRAAALAVNSVGFLSNTVLGFGESIPYYFFLQEDVKLVHSKPKQESIDGHACYVLESTGQFGSYRIWISPEFGFQVLKSISIKQPSDYSPWCTGIDEQGMPRFKNNGPSDDPKRAMTIDHVQLIRKGGFYYLAAADAHNIETLKDGSVWDWSRKIRTANCDTSPSAQRYHAFDMSLIPNGTLVEDDETRELSKKQGSQAYKVWEDGQALLSDVPESVIIPLGVKYKPGQMAPDFSGKTLNGKTVKLSDYRGKPVLIDFWATWCGGCVEEMPNLTKIYKEYHPRGLEIIGVSVDDSSPTLSRYLQKHAEISWDQLFDARGRNNPIVQSYDVHGYPQLMLIDGTGKVRGIGLGGLRVRIAVEKLFNKNEKLLSSGS